MINAFILPFSLYLLPFHTQFTANTILAFVHIEYCIYYHLIHPMIIYNIFIIVFDTYSINFNTSFNTHYHKLMLFRGEVQCGTASSTFFRKRILID